MSKKLSNRDLSILIGNILDHFDTTLYGFLAPLLAPVFFPNSDPVVSVILAYSIVATSIVTRPVGTYIFGVLAAIYTPLLSLSYSLIGVAILTVMIGLVPSYETAGPLAPALLIIIRSVRGIFAAGESTVAKLFILENRERQAAFRNSYLYQCSSILGIVLASLASTVVIYSEVHEGWRVCFWLGGITAFFGYSLRKYKSDTDNLQKVQLFNSYLSFFSEFGKTGVKSLFHHKKNVIRIAFVNSFSHITYSVPFIVMNNIVPLITHIELKTMMSVNTALLVLDMILIPCIGRLLENHDPRKIMFYSAASLALTIFPLWYFIDGGSLTYICFVRCWIVFWGVVFLCPLNLWCRSLVEGEDKYLIVGIANALGSSTIGKMTPAICMSLYYYTGNHLSIAIYIMLVMIATLLSLG